MKILIVCLATTLVGCATEHRADRLETELQKIQQDMILIKGELTAERLRVSVLAGEHSDTRLLARFGYSISCDGSQYKLGTNGASAYRALMASGLCDPGEKP